MRCPHCNSSIPYNAATCGHCGGDVPLTGGGSSRVGDYWSGIVITVSGLAIGLCGLIAVYAAVRSLLGVQGPVTAVVLGLVGAGFCALGWRVVRGGIRLIRGPYTSSPQRHDRV